MDSLPSPFRWSLVHRVRGRRPSRWEVRINGCKCDRSVRRSCLPTDRHDRCCLETRHRRRTCSFLLCNNIPGCRANVRGHGSLPAWISPSCRYFPNGTGSSCNWKPNIRLCFGASSIQNSSALLASADRPNSFSINGLPKM